MAKQVYQPPIGMPLMAEQGKYLGERLVSVGIVTETQVRQALEVQRRSGGFLGQILVDLGYASAKEVGQRLAQHLGVAYVDLQANPPDPVALSLLTEEAIRDTQSLPWRLSGDILEVVTLDPLNVAALDTIHLLTGKRILPALTMSGEFQRILNETFDASSRASEVLLELEHEETEEGQGRRARADLAAATDAPIVRLVDSLIESAIAQRASDIHFEPQERLMRVRYRIDGVLLEQTEIPRVQVAPTLARLKVLCMMDITETRRPQDGRIRFDYHGRAFDIRVSSVPTVNGEKMVLRILDKSVVLVPLSKLGLLPDQQKQLEGLIRQPHGMILLVGPTGSGKSTTLYSALNLLNDSKRNIMTLEDPVEYNVAGLNQIQVNSKLGLTFASGLRTFVRQDPDVILVGEIRDVETAEMAIQAALTGHLLLSTLHTNSAAGTVARLKNLGVDPFLIAQALSGVVSQRLVAKICTNCVTEYEPSIEVLEAVGIPWDTARTMRHLRGKGCRACYGRGYLGRMAVYEILQFDEEIRRLILRGASEHEINATARDLGMLSLRDAAFLAVQEGITTLEEMGRVALAKEG